MEIQPIEMSDLRFSGESKSPDAKPKPERFFLNVDTEKPKEESKKKKWTLEELGKEPYIMFEGKRVYQCLEPIIFWEFCICDNCGKLQGAHSNKECRKCDIDPPYEIDEDSSSTYKPTSSSSASSDSDDEILL